MSNDPLSARVRGRVSARAGSLFSHGDYALANTLAYRQDPGLFGPDSMTWPVLGNAAVFVGGIRALLVQAAHPEVAAGVAEHSRYRQDPLGRLTRTAAYVTATAFGAMPEVQAAVATVRRRHRPVSGRSDRGEPYDAADPALAAWVHNALTDSFLTAYLTYGGQPCTTAEADRFVGEQVRVGALLGAEPLAETSAKLSAWIAEHPDIEASPGGAEAVAFLLHPPLPGMVSVAYGRLFRAAVATLPDRIRTILGLAAHRGGVRAGRLSVGALRWALGPSPDWQLALARTGAQPPPGVRFHKPLPTQPAS